MPCGKWKWSINQKIKIQWTIHEQRELHNEYNLVFVNALWTCSRTFSGKIRLPKMEQTAVSQLIDWTAAGVAASQLKTCTVGDWVILCLVTKHNNNPRSCLRNPKTTKFNKTQHMTDDNITLTRWTFRDWFAWNCLLWLN